MYTTASEKELDITGDADSIFKYCKDKNYSHCFGQYCAQEDTPDAVAATMGYACGANRGLANDAYTLAYKRLPGVTPDNLTESQVSHICGSAETTGNNGNVYIVRGEEYYVLQQGYCANGQSFDEVVYLDMLKNEITLKIENGILRRFPEYRKNVKATSSGFDVAFDSALSTKEDAISLVNLIDSITLLYIAECKE